MRSIRMIVVAIRTVGKSIRTWIGADKTDATAINVPDEMDVMTFENRVENEDSCSPKHIGLRHCFFCCVIKRYLHSPDIILGGCDKISTCIFLCLRFLSLSCTC